ncbi:hypothetical protein CDEST_02000 [Colletotrichum destructivum]|uniref:Uncharacterized protein n=1 Tax=Colletotrichum destructivum TaxID=34406 RepID=A0AAX4I0P1_9PEZI|nr:hypothetical protein CDEST_02000 [Colletotrichum destructivum]
MDQPRNTTKHLRWLSSVPYLLAIISCLMLNFAPLVPFEWLYDYLPTVDPDCINLVLLQCFDDLQESLILFVQPMLDTSVSVILSDHPDPDTRELTSKSDSLTAVLKVWAIKLPSLTVAIFSILPYSIESLKAIIGGVVICAILTLGFVPVVKKTQDRKRERDKAL